MQLCVEPTVYCSASGLHGFPVLRYCMFHCRRALLCEPGLGYVGRGESAETLSLVVPNMCELILP